jgi:hypothetical protein
LAEQVERALGSQYRVEEHIGRGGAAVIFRVHDTRLNRDLAAKVLKPSLLGDAELAERFRREAVTAARLNHPNIVPIFFVGGEGHVPCYVMPLVEGEALAERIEREGELPLDVIVGIVRDIAGALDFAHGAGVIHRDVKPDNILLDAASGRSLLTDFGIAKAVAAHSTITGSGVVVGTPYYVSPEQAAGEVDIDYRTDVYSLGVVVYEMLAGEPPFTASTPDAVFAHHVRTPPPPVGKRRADVSDRLEDVLLQALAKNPKDRFAGAGEFARALERAYGRRSLRLSGGVTFQHMPREGRHSRKTMQVDTTESGFGSLKGADDLTTVTTGASNVERMLLAAAERRDWSALVEGIAVLDERVQGDPDAATRLPVLEVLERLGVEAGVVEVLATSWATGDEQAQVRIEQALATLPNVGPTLTQFAREERSAEAVLLADRTGALTADGGDALARDDDPTVVHALVAALRESQRPADLITRWLEGAMRHDDEAVRLAVVDVAAIRGGMVADRIGRGAQEDPSPDVRREAARVAGSHPSDALPEPTRGQNPPLQD